MQPDEWFLDLLLNIHYHLYVQDPLFLGKNTPILGSSYNKANIYEAFVSASAYSIIFHYFDGIQTLSRPFIE